MRAFLLLSILLTVLPLSAEVLRLKPGAVIAYEFSPPMPGQPTFLLMPGVNRGMRLDDEAAVQLIKSGAGVVTFNFSVQPLSIAELPEAERANLKGITLESLAEETKLLALRIRDQIGGPLSDLIPVSLSYSGAVSPFLRDFSKVIEVVPLTSFSAFNPQLSAYYSSLKAAEFYNPIFGPGITRSSLDAAYRSQWYPQVTALARQFELPAARFEEMVEGYTTLSRAVEGFSWFERPPEKKVNRYFILAENESRSLKADQLATIRELQAQGYSLEVKEISRSGHIIPVDQPKAYVEALLSIARGRIPVSQ